MFVVKRDGRQETVKFDEITERIRSLCAGLSEHIDPTRVALKVIEGLYDGVSTEILDHLSAETAAGMTTVHPDYAVLAARIALSDLYKNTEASFSKNLAQLYHYRDPLTDRPARLIAEDCFAISQKYAKQLDAALDESHDLSLDYFGYKTLERSYLLRCNGKIAERPQQMLMRVAIGIHGDDLEAILETYSLLSQAWFTHATPTLFNAGTPRPQMSSCFLLTMQGDSIEGIYDTLKNCAKISQSAGGIGLSIHKIRATGSYIAGTNGTSNGIVPMLRVFNDTARYVDQGGGKRKGAFAVYLEPWHADVEAFLDLRKNHGKEELRARDLFYALWISDLFMQRVEAEQDWSLFCPHEAPGLADCWGEDFNALYTRYEQAGLARKTLPARELWLKIVESQIETGTPFLLYKDAANAKSNQQHLGTIRSSNLCTEIIEYTAPDEVAVCNLASLSLPRFVRHGEFDHQKLFDVTQVVTRNLNKIIDRNAYPVPEAETSNFRHRPIGIGVQGLADTFIQLRYPFDSDAARKLNQEIFETLYYAALSASNQLAQEQGAYPSYQGSPAERGLLQPDLWQVETGPRWDWTTLRDNIHRFGLRNSLLLAPMPTASTSQILGNNECIEPYTSNVYTRRVLSGEFVVVNKHLLKDLIDLGLWNEELKQALIRAQGSVQGLAIPEELKALYKTVWEIKQKVLIDMAADRGAFICQSQSLNLFLAQPTAAQLTSMHFYAWKKGLKTGLYYLRTRAAADAIQFTLAPQSLEKKDPQVLEALLCSIENPEDCEACGA